MKCKHCGKEISWNAQFCEACGGANEPLLAKMKSYILPYWQKFITLCGKKKWLLPALTGGVLLLVILCIVLNQPKTIDFTDYVFTEVKGYENCGEVSVYINYAELTKDILGKEPDATNKKTYEKYIEYRKNAASIQASLDVYTNNDEPLKNGDIFLVTVKIKSSEVFEELGYEIKEKEQNIPLQIGKDTKKFDELIDVDLLEHITVNFTGKNGDGKAEISHDQFNIDVVSSSGEEYTLSFCYITPLWGNASFEVYSSRESDLFAMVRVSVENGNHLSNGDKVKIVLEHDEGTLANALKISIDNREKEFTVTGLE